jgi:hypothetical protein
MFDLLTAPAMATPSEFTAFVELVKANGLLATAKSLDMSHRTVAVRIDKPGTFTLKEMQRLADSTENDLGEVVAQLVKEATAGAKSTPQKGMRSTSVEVNNKELVLRVKNPETMSHDELAMLAKLTGSTLTNLTSQVAAQKAKQAGEPTTIAELIHGMGGRYETAKDLGMSPNTLATRMKKPGGFTLNDLLAVATVANKDVIEVAKLAQYQMKNGIAPPIASAGRPPLRPSITKLSYNEQST